MILSVKEEVPLDVRESGQEICSKFWSNNQGTKCDYCDHCKDEHFGKRFQIVIPCRSLISVDSKSSVIQIYSFEHPNGTGYYFDVPLTTAMFTVSVDRNLVFRVTKKKNWIIETVETEKQSPTTCFRTQGPNYCNHPTCLQEISSQKSDYCSPEHETDARKLRQKYESSYYHCFSLCREYRKILFYEKGEDYYEFTNFYDVPNGIFIDGQKWTTTEHYFQAQKFTRKDQSPLTLWEILASVTIEQRKQILRDCQFVSQPDMNLVKEFVKKLLCQSPHLYQILMDTGDAKLIYCGDYSFWWGNRNVFGQLLEQIRNEGQKKNKECI
eukprot:TRINITY_DN3602_c0_g2_i2.p1 TRINITY_DN3602_c0_g2~~TRINITY_DN3602_c0_g2_i2.p1  ORF type:complete len:325 (-),score=40.35 TRINITY_DN3602_c0_g2_i2:621-1595(-)